MGLPYITQQATFVENSNTVRVAFWIAQGRPICNCSSIRLLKKSSPSGSTLLLFMGLPYGTQKATFLRNLPPLVVVKKSPPGSNQGDFFVAGNWYRKWVYPIPPAGRLLQKIATLYESPSGYHRVDPFLSSAIKLINESPFGYHRVDFWRACPS